VSPIKRDVAEGSRSRYPLVVRNCRLAFWNDAKVDLQAGRTVRHAFASSSFVPSRLA
jgi:hypothetical protein